MRSSSRNMTTNVRMWAGCKFFLLALGLITVHTTIFAAEVHPANFKHHVVFNKPGQKSGQLGTGTVGMQYASPDAMAITDSNSISQHTRAANGKFEMKSNRRYVSEVHAPDAPVPPISIPLWAPAPRPQPPPT